MREDTMQERSSFISVFAAVVRGVFTRDDPALFTEEEIRTLAMELAAKGVDLSCRADAH